MVSPNGGGPEFSLRKKYCWARKVSDAQNFSAAGETSGIGFASGEAWSCGCDSADLRKIA